MMKEVFCLKKLRSMQNKSLGPFSEHVRDVYNDAKLRVVNFQMHKHLGGIMKNMFYPSFKIWKSSRWFIISFTGE